MSPFRPRITVEFRLLWVMSFALLCFTSGQLAAEDDIKELKLRDWEPRSMLVTRSRLLERPRFPVIDIHNHLGGGAEYLTPERVKRYLTEMDEAGVQTVVNLDGGWDDGLVGTLKALDQAHPGRFLTFTLINFDGIDDEGWTERELKRIEASFAAGACGLKIHKGLGLRVRYRDGRVMPVDDPKLDPIWAACGKHHRPVVIHVGDPAAFFTPLDRYNERWHELNANPHWLFYGDQFPPREEILAQLHRVIGRHPETIFVNTHFGNNAENLAAVGKKLDQYPNMYVDFDARISELGRQPFTARRFFLKYQDRILFGTDTTPKRDAFRIYYRFLETDDEYFDSSPSHHRQGFWMIYGLNLPPEVLEKIYFRNAERVLGRTLVPKPDENEDAPTKAVHVKSTKDFELRGDGTAEQWAAADWQTLPVRQADRLNYASRFKVLYSSTGIYVLFEGADQKLSATIQKDFENLWTEDVFEFFFWPDASQTSYFEYEISPLGFELPLIVTQSAGKRHRWRAWANIDSQGGISRGIRKATSVNGAKQSQADVKGWKAEIFVPYELLSSITSDPPRPGTVWRANFYRVDYDDGKTTAWTWTPVDGSFHSLDKFGRMVFD